MISIYLQVHSFVDLTIKWLLSSAADTAISSYRFIKFAPSCFTHLHRFSHISRNLFVTLPSTNYQIHFAFQSTSSCTYWTHSAIPKRTQFFSRSLLSNFIVLPFAPHIEVLHLTPCTFFFIIISLLSLCMEVCTSSWHCTYSSYTLLS